MVKLYYIAMVEGFRKVQEVEEELGLGDGCV